MRKFILIILVLAALGGVGYIVYMRFLGANETRACMKLAELCGGKMSRSGLEECTKLFDKLRYAAGGEKTAAAMECILGSKSCIGGGGCGAGAGLGTVGEFAGGIKRWFEQKNKK